MIAANASDQPLREVVTRRLSQRRDERQRFGEVRLRQLCTERGLNWNQLTESQREDFVNRLLHEKQ